MKRRILNTLKVVTIITVVYVIAIVVLAAISPKLIPNEEEDEDFELIEDDFE